MGAPKDWFCPSYAIPADTVEQISDWVDSVAWPEGTEFKDPAKYHITCFYSRTGYSDPAHQQWVKQLPAQTFPVAASRVDVFDVSDGDTMAPVVLVFDGPELYAHAAQVTDEGEARGLEPIRHPDGYHAHITIAFVPVAETLPELPVPPIAAQAGPLFEQHAHNDELKARRAAAVE